MNRERENNSQTEQQEMLHADNEHTNTAWQNDDAVVNNTNTIEMLTEIYNNALMAKEGTEAVLKHIEDMDLANLCREQIIKYDEFCRNAQIIANKFGCTISDKNKGARMMAKMNTKIKLAADNSTSAIAEMVILGTINGVIDLGKLIRHKNGVDQKATTLAKQLLAYEEDKIDLMKFYL